jgi:monoamine oxidase
MDTDPIYPEGREIYYFDGRSHSRAAVLAEEPAAQAIADAQFARIRWPATYANKNRWNEHFDRMTVADWIDAYTPHGLDSVYGEYLKVYFETEYGGPISRASAITMIADFSAPGPNYDERYLVEGGSDLIVKELRSRLPAGSVVTKTPLRALRRKDDGTYRCTFQSGSSLRDVTADRVVLALPFTALRRVDYRGAGFSPLMRTAIERLGMGQNSKLNFQFTRPAWEPSADGASLSDLAAGSTWPGELGQAGPQGIMVMFNGTPFSTSYGDVAAHGPAPAHVVSSTLETLDRLFPDVSEHVIPGQAYVDCWPLDPWVEGSYAYYETGGFTTFAGVEGERQGNVHFAGEHTEPFGYNGLMNGAVSSGERAAREILADYGN